MKKEAKSRFSLMHFVLAVALLSIIQPLLIMANIISTVSDYLSIGTIFFNILKLAIMIYAGAYFVKEGLKKIALNGALMGFVSSGIIVLFSLISKQCCDKPILGINISMEFYWLAMFFIIIENMIIWTLIVTISGWISSKMKRK